MMIRQVSPLLLLITTLLLGFSAPGDAIDCFFCDSLDGSRRDCEDEFGPPNKTKHLIQRACRVGVLNFSAHYCIKIKGVKENGQHIIVRTCAVDDWGTQCGDLLIEQEGTREPITGCLATCDFDGCNSASHVSSSNLISGIAFYSIAMILTSSGLKPCQVR